MFKVLAAASLWAALAVPSPVAAQQPPSPTGRAPEIGALAAGKLKLRAEEKRAQSAAKRFCRTVKPPFRHCDMRRAEAQERTRLGSESYRWSLVITGTWLCESQCLRKLPFWKTDWFGFADFRVWINSKGKRRSKTSNRKCYPPGVFPPQTC